MTKANTITSGEVRGFIKQTKASNGFLLHMLESAEARETVRALLSIKPESKGWKGYAYVPAGSLIDDLIQAFEKHTDFPLELPFHSFLFYASGYLMNAGTRVKFGGRERSPELWTIVLAPSGCGKTLSAQLIGKMAPVKADFPECASGARFLQAMEEFEQSNKTTLWIQDEISQKLKQMETIASPLADMKEYLLRAYDGSRIERSIKTGTIVVEHPCLGLLGLNTDEGFFKAISPESLVDGFSQRFGFVVAEKDENRKMYDYPRFDEEALQAAAGKAFARLQAVPLHPVYRFDKAGNAAYDEAFRQLIGTADIPDSFYRRVMFRVCKYALLYHLILAKETDEIDAEDVSWASRLCRQQMMDARRMLAGSLSDLTRMIEVAERLRGRLATEGKKLTARDIVRGVHGIKTAAEARGLLSLIDEAPAQRKAA